MIITDKMWDDEAARIYDREPMLTWEACKMIAWNNFSNIYGEVEYEGNNRKVSEEG